MNFFYIKIPVGTSLADREHIFHEGLESALTTQKAGTVLGWGDSVSRPNANEPARLAFHRIDIEITDFKPALTLIQHTLVTLNAPLGTEIHYTVDRTAFQDISSATGWHTEACHTGTQRRNRLA
jgi:hypothetical protein